MKNSQRTIFIIIFFGGGGGLLVYVRTVQTVPVSTMSTGISAVPDP